MGCGPAYFCAAAAHVYPYGNHVRFGLYFAPIFCLLTGLGGASILAAVRPRRRAALAGVSAVLALLVIIAVSASVRDFLKPYKEPCWMRNRDLARWFWTDKAVHAELLCLRTDLHRQFYEPLEGDDLASIFYCNQRIYSPRHAQGKPPQLELVSATHPLRCVRFRPGYTNPGNDADFHGWLEKMERSFRLVSQESYPMTFPLHNPERLFIDQVEVYEFVPKEMKTASVLVLDDLR